MRIAQIGLREARMTFDRLYSYEVPETLLSELRLGHRVLIPFGRGNRLVEGLVLSLEEMRPTRELKSIWQILDPYPVLYPDQLRLASLMVQRYACTWGSVLRLMLPSQLTLQRSFRLQLTPEGEERARLLDRDRRSDLAPPLEALQEEQEGLTGLSGKDCSVEKRETQKQREVSNNQAQKEEFRPLSPETLVQFLFHKRGKTFSLRSIYQQFPDAADAIALAQARGWILCTESLQSQKGRKIRTAALVDPQEAERLLETNQLRSIRQIRTFELLLEYGELPVQDLCSILSTTPSYLHPLIQRGWICCNSIPESWWEIQEESAEDEAVEAWENVEATRLLTEEQQTVYDALLSVLVAERTPGDLHEHLLHGVTGSGKTEIYLRLTQWALENRKSVLLLVPEIALTPQMCQQFHMRFGERVSVLHSRLRPSERQQTWDRVRKSEVQIVVGPRSAIFAPIRNLGLLIVDEEQERSYVSEMHPRYDARTLARLRAKETGALLLLGSATPSVEAYYRTQSGQSILHTMHERPGCAVLPEVQLVDMKLELQLGNASPISAALQQELRSLRARGEQAILLLNRRGYASTYFCTQCGHTISCPRCSVHMTYHKSGSRLICHACGYTQQAPRLCPECQEPTMTLQGLGTQQIEEEVQHLFPGMRTLRLDQDAASQILTHSEILNRFRNHEADVLVGTQMVAKGHDFPDVTIVGILDADRSLYLPDFRAGERAFQLFTQAAGRAGRASRPGRVILQTFHPLEPILIQAMQQNYEAFVHQELRFRQIQGYPPFGACLTLTISGLQEEEVRNTAHMLEYDLRQRFQEEQLQWLPILPAPLARINRRYQFQIGVHASGIVPLVRMMQFVSRIEFSSSIRVQWMLDPA